MDRQTRQIRCLSDFAEKRVENWQAELQSKRREALTQTCDLGHELIAFGETAERLPHECPMCLLIKDRDYYAEMWRRWGGEQ